jgi:hypothetical protein
MPPLKAIEQANWGGVDSRSNPIAEPQNKFLQLTNWRVRIDGHLELRPGYATAFPNLPTLGGGALHSIYGFVSRGAEIPPGGGPPPGPAAGTRCVLFWQGTTPYIIRFDTGAVYNPVILGNPITSSHRWQYALGKNSKIYMHNGTDRKFFDGLVMRDIGLPMPTATSLASVVVTSGTPAAGTAAPSATDATGVQMQYVDSTLQSPPFTANWVTDDSKLFFAFFNTNNNMLLPSSTPLGGGVIPQVPLGGGGLTVTSGHVQAYWGATQINQPPDYTKTKPVLKGDIAVTFWGAGLSGVLKNHTLFNIAGDPSTGTPTAYYSAGGDHSPGAGFPADFVGCAIADASGNAMQFAQNEALGAQVNFPGAVAGANQVLQLTDLPVSNAPGIVGLISVQTQDAQGASFLSAQNMPNGSMSAQDATTVNITLPNHGLVSGDVFTLYLVSGSQPLWPSSGPFTAIYRGVDNFWFTVPDSTPYGSPLAPGPVGVCKLIVQPHNATTYTFTNPTWPPPLAPGQGTDTGSHGILLPWADLPSPNLLAASAIGGAQPGYQFWVSIYNNTTGHVGNRMPIGGRIVNTSDAQVTINGLPNLNGLSLPDLRSLYWPKNMMKDVNVTGDYEWSYLIGRTGDGGEVPYAVTEASTDANGNLVYNWVYTNSSYVNITSATIDGNAELPINNYIPPPFQSFWREGDKMCGTIPNQPSVFRSGSELDSTTGIFVGDPAEAWAPVQVETFPTAAPIIGGFGYMQESWTFTANDSCQLSELSGELAWNGPYNFGIAGPYAFDTGWNSLPFWVSHDKQLCTMLPSANGPMPISTEYEAALLARIDDAHKDKTEVVYFRDPLRLVEVLRIKCVEVKTDSVSGISYSSPYVVIHDFNLRDDSSPYGQAYEEIYANGSPLGPPNLPVTATVSADFTHSFVRDGAGHARMWGGASDGNLYQLYTGGDDAGHYFTADAIQLRYLGGERTAVKTLEWYGDQLIQWYIFENMLNVIADPVYWVNLSWEARPVPGDAQNGHFMADFQRPEMTHCYLWASLTAHPFDAPTPSDPMALSVPPHIPVETYGRLFLSAPILGDSRGR